MQNYRDGRGNGGDTGALHQKSHSGGTNGEQNRDLSKKSWTTGWKHCSAKSKKIKNKGIIGNPVMQLISLTVVLYIRWFSSIYNHSRCNQ